MVSLYTLKSMPKAVQHHKDLQSLVTARGAYTQDKEAYIGQDGKLHLFNNEAQLSELSDKL